MDNFKNFAQLNTLSKEKIKSQNIALRDLWLIKDQNDKVFGPFHTADIQQECNNSPDTFKQTQACNMQHEKWYEFYSIQVFGRRKDNASKIEVNSNQKLFVMINGQKNGPYTTDETQKLLNNGHIEYSSQVSIDHGDTWFKLWDHPSFDRRAKKTNEQLPFLPSNDILELVSKTKDEILNTYDSEDPILELAYIGHNKSEKEKNSPPKFPESDDHSVFDEVIESDEKSRSSKLKYAYVLSIVALFATAGVFFMNESTVGPTIVEQKAVKKTAVPTPKQRKPAAKTNTRRTVKKITPKTYKAPKTVTRRPTPARVNRTNNRNQRMQANERRMRLQQDAEKLDINDPAFQEEISRKISSDYDMDERDDNYPQDDPYGDEKIPADNLQEVDLGEPNRDDAPYQDEQDPYQDERDQDYPEDY